MTNGPFLKPEQLEEFNRRGVLRLGGLMSPERVRLAREYVQDRLARLGLWKEGAWHLDDHRPRWPDHGLKASKAIGNKHPLVEALLDEPALNGVVAAFLEGQPFDRKTYKRPQVLFTLPNIDVWTVPNGWHVDAPRLASGRRPGIQLFVFLDTVEPRGGGTLVVAGSHRLFSEGQFMRVRELRRNLCRYEYFRALYSQAPSEPLERAQLLNRVGSVEGVSVEVVELTGAPGDAYFVDLRVLHTGAPNANDRPRMMATHRFVLSEVMQELALGYGWKE